MIPAGCFDMGDHFNEGDSNELPVHNVCITSDFYMELMPIPGIPATPGTTIPLRLSTTRPMATGFMT